MTDSALSTYSLNNDGVHNSDEIKCKDCMQKQLIDENVALKKELADTTKLLQAFINFPQIMTDSPVIKKLVDPTIEINNLNYIHNQVIAFMFNFFTQEKVDRKLKSIKCDVIRDLIKR